MTNVGIPKRLGIDKVYDKGYDKVAKPLMAIFGNTRIIDAHGAAVTSFGAHPSLHYSNPLSTTSLAGRPGPSQRPAAIGAGRRVRR